MEREQMQHQAPRAPITEREKKPNPESRGWDFELLEQAQAAIKRLVEARHAIVNIPTNEGVGPDGLDLNPNNMKRLHLILPDQTLDGLTKAAAVLATAGGILMASPAYACIQR
mgnify:FL=1